MLGVLRSRLSTDFVIVNGENAAGGLGITQPIAKSLFVCGADVITLGNHSFAKRDAVALFKDEHRLIRPANYPPGAPGAGWGMFDVGNKGKVGVLSLVGRVFMNPMDCPFRRADEILAELAAQTSVIIVDMHAEATSEKVALGWYLDGRVSAVIGTHTHTPTADERILPKGTAYITDAGMTGVRDSVLGLDRQVVIEKFISQIPTKFQLADGEAMLQGVLVDVDESSGRAKSIRRLSYLESDEIIDERRSNVD